ncbi:Transcriptional regulatory protein walR [Chryseobacterium gleum]|jgi:DNA-binding response OmpR family regulator|uniref:Transcriptional regulatory protein walR n=2 Tax=Chryseobacterium gleum TaxID=250 RepID=A0A448AW47_CHRGE|nr:response regulator [Chryseobacterium gleum]EFK35331.1 response regulator receiver domain protein [Chryseobacterium gleum ATCC 35910]MCD9619080.1 response regulator [Chryseobacterium gleum]QBJ84811.1 response regulator [Chryseobacterium gleum]QQY31111.1 response regulator [Chryseobacterium gleum]VEE04511.1 Transcriptional regulatory protein walR [Chryseobacterium gleum]
MRKIIIADDEHKILMSLEYSFKKNGYDVYIARDGTEVLDFLKTMVPDVILLDIMMPNLDGYSTLDIIRQDEKLKGTKVIFLSAKNNPRDIEKGLEMGADAYVTKPYSIKKLMQQIEEMF